MCGRYVLGISPKDLSDFFELSEIRLSYRPRFNVVPTTSIPVVRPDENASREAMVGTDPLLQDTGRPTAAPNQCQGRNGRNKVRLSRGLCQTNPNGVNQPFVVSRKDNQPLALGGIWELARGQASAAIITKQAAAVVRSIHDRMPATIARSDWRRWLAPIPLASEESKRILSPQDQGLLQALPVSARVNNVRNDDPSLIEPIGEGPDDGAERSSSGF